MLYLNTERTEQPCDPPEPALDGPLGEHLLGVMTPYGNWTPGDTNNIVLDYHQHGVGFSSNGFSSRFDLPGYRAVSVHPVWSFAVLFRLEDQGARSCVTYCERPDNTQICKLEVNRDGSANESMTLVVRDASNNLLILAGPSLGAGTIFDGKYHTAVVTQGAPNDIAIYLDGVLYTTYTSTNYNFNFGPVIPALAGDPFDGSQPAQYGGVYLEANWLRVLSADEAREFHNNPWQVCAAPGAMLTAVAAGGSAAPTGLSVETDSALALAGVQIRATGLAAETDNSLALTGVAIRPTGLAAEADSALGLTALHIRATGLSVEVDSSLALTGVSIRATGLAAETDSAFALAPLQLAPAGVAVEADSAFSLAALQIRAVGRSDENDSAFALTGGIAGGVGRADENDSALALAPVQIMAVGRADVQEVALALAGVQIRPVGLAADAETAFALTPLQVRQVGMAVELDLCVYTGGSAPAAAAQPSAHFIVTTGRLMAM